MREIELDGILVGKMLSDRVVGGGRGGGDMNGFEFFHDLKELGR